MDDIERIINNLMKVRDDYDFVLQHHRLDSMQRTMINDAIRTIRRLEAGNQTLQEELQRKTGHNE